MKKLFKAEQNQLDEVLGFIDANLEAAGCPVSAQMSIDVCVEEAFINVASYAFPDTDGEASVSVDVLNEAGASVCVITLEDGGVPFNPLARPDPDTSLQASDRGIGGLGILMVKKMMDDVDYEYSGGMNRLTMKKHF